MTVKFDADAVIAGGGLAGLATAHELLDRDLRVLVLDRDTEDRLGGLAKRSFGGVMFVDTPHQRKLGLKDTPELAWADWQSFADFGDDDELAETLGEDLRRAVHGAHFRLAHWPRNQVSTRRQLG